jgi:hypothetical protein
VSPISLTILYMCVVISAAMLTRLVAAGEARWVAMVGALASLTGSVMALLWAISGNNRLVTSSLWGLTASMDRFSYTVAPSLSLGVFVLVTALPRRDAQRHALSRSLIMLAASLAGLISGDLITLGVAESVGALVAAQGLPSVAGRRVMWLSLGFMWLGALTSPSLALPAEPQGLPALPLTLFLIAGGLRLGVPLLATGLLDQLGRGLCASSVLLAAPFGGVVLLARVVHPGMHAYSAGAHALMGVMLALSLIYGLVSITQRDLGRALGYVLSASHMLLLVGLVEPATAVGFMGSELLWSAMLLAEVGLLLAYTLVESRVGPLSLHLRHGLNDSMPRLARLSLLLTLSVAALPGSMDFIAIEMLLSGESTHSVGGALLMAASLSAIAFGLVRVHFRVFFGRPSQPPHTLEGLPRELMALSLLLVALLVGGLAPSVLPLLR